MEKSKVAQYDLSRLGASIPEGAGAGTRTNQILLAYNALRAFESDYDKAQGLLRTIASAWLLAGVGAVGFLVNAEVASSGWDHVVAAAARQAVILVVALGVSALWRLDQKVYQRLLHTVYALGYRIECEFDIVPPTRRALFAVNGDITNDLSHFYQLPFNLIFAVGLLNFIAGGWLVHDPGLSVTPIDPELAKVAIVFAAATFAVHFGYCVYANSESKKWGNLRDFLAGISDPSSPNGPA